MDWIKRNGPFMDYCEEYQEQIFFFFYFRRETL